MRISEERVADSPEIVGGVVGEASGCAAFCVMGYGKREGTHHQELVMAGFG